MKQLIVTLCTLAILLPSLASAGLLETTILVYKGKHKMVGHEFAVGGSQGTPFKVQDEVWLIIEIDVNTWDVINAREVYYWKTEAGYEGEVVILHNLDLVVDTVSSKQVATLHSLDLNNDGGLVPSDIPSDMDALMLQGSMALTFTGASEYLVPKNLKGVGMGLWESAGGTYNNIGAGQLSVSLDKAHTIEVNRDMLGIAGAVYAVVEDLMLDKGVVFPGGFGPDFGGIGPDF